MVHLVQFGNSAGASRQAGRTEDLRSGWGLQLSGINVSAEVTAKQFNHLSLCDLDGEEFENQKQQYSTQPSSPQSRLSQALHAPLFLKIITDLLVVDRDTSKQPA